MDRVVRIDPDLLAWSKTLSAEDRLRQAMAAFRMYYALHRPYEKPFRRGFDSFEEWNAFRKETRHRSWISTGVGSAEGS